MRNLTFFVAHVNESLEMILFRELLLYQDCTDQCYQEPKTRQRLTYKTFFFVVDATAQ